MVFVGMDVHVRNSYLCATDAAGQVLRRGRVGNTLLEVARFLGALEKEPMLVSLESTTNSRAICHLLQQYGREAGVDLTARVLHARKLRVIAESVGKCDKLDAAMLCELSRSNLRLPVCYVPDDEVFALREHLRARADLVRVRTMLKNRVHAVLHRRNILTPAGDLFSQSGQAFVKELELDEAGRQILEHYLALIGQVNGEIGGSDQALSALSRQVRWSKPLALLRTMPGIGLIVGLTILAELGDPQRFRSRAAVSNFAGLVPVVRDSDTKRYRGGITQRGPAQLRRVLNQAAWVSVMKVPRYADLFGRVAGRSGKQVAITAVARRMLEDAWTMLKKEEAFRFEPLFNAKPGVAG